jgi:hypothetical protein
MQVITPYRWYFAWTAYTTFNIQLILNFMFILTLLSVSWMNRFSYAWETLKLNRCIISWKVIQIDINREENCDITNIITKWVGWDYSLTTYSIPLQPNPKIAGFCTKQNIFVYYLYWDWWKIWISYLPEIWDNVNFLVDRDSYKVISPNKISNWEYEITYWNYTSKENFDICEPNLWEDTEIQKETRRLHSYLNKLSYHKPRVITRLKTALESIDLSKYSEKTKTLTEAVKKIIEELVR